LYVVFIVLLGWLTVSVVRSIVAIKEQRIAAQSLLDYADILSFDPRREGGHLKPNLDGWMLGERLDLPARIITNSKGFRNSREFTYEVPARTFRVMLLGDSYVDGMRTDQHRTIGHLLERFLHEEACNEQTDAFEVIVSAHNNPVDAWYAYQEFGHRYDPHLVVLGVTLGNDLTWHSYQKSEPSFSSGGSTPYAFHPAKDASGNPALVLTTEVERQPWAPTWFPDEAYIPKRENGFLGIAGKWADRPLHKVESRLRMLANKVFPRWTGYMVPAVTDPTVNNRRLVDTRDFNTSLGLFYTPTLPHIETDYTSFFEVVKGFKAAVHRREGTFSLALFPTRLQVSKREWELFLTYYFLDPAKFDLSRPNKLIGEACQQDSLPCLDLLDPFRTHYQQNGTHLYRAQGDMHFNEHGQELAAKELSAFVKGRLESQGLVSRACATS
jgi:hypothetical protein